jgi:uncharacterized protein
MSYQTFVEITDEMLTEVEAYDFQRKQIIDSLEPPRHNVVLVKGLRGVGKTTAILQFLLAKREAGHKVLYLSADSSLIQEKTLLDYAKEFKTRGGGYLVFDEIHKYPAWEKEVLDIVNFYTNIKLIASGSSSLQIDQSLADISRRHILVQAHGMSFGEWAALEHKLSLQTYSYPQLLETPEEIAFAINKVFKASHLSVVDEFHRYLKEGYFPSRRNYPSYNLYQQSVANTINAIIEQDIPSRFQDITEVTQQNLKRLIGNIAGHCPFVPTISTLREVLQLGDDKTVKRYLYMLHEGKVLNNLYQPDRSYKSIPKPEKVYLENTNFMYALQDSTDIGNVRETFAVCMLSKVAAVRAPKLGDILVNNNATFEIGGKGKTRKQIKKITNSYVLNDTIDYANGSHLPLWLLGFLW